MKFLMIALSGLLSSCAHITPAGSRVKIVEQEGSLLEISETADKLVAKHNCSFVGFVDAKTSLFPGSYSLHDNEIHTALRNRAAKIGANVVVANFYRKPAQGIGLSCPDDV